MLAGSSFPSRSFRRELRERGRRSVARRAVPGPTSILLRVMQPNTDFAGSRPGRQLPLAQGADAVTAERGYRCEVLWSSCPPARLFTLTYLRFGYSAETLVVCAALSILLIVTLIDLEHGPDSERHRLPNDGGAGGARPFSGPSWASQDRCSAASECPLRYSTRS